MWIHISSTTFVQKHWLSLLIKSAQWKKNQMINGSIKSHLTILYLNLNTIYSASKSHQGLSITPSSISQIIFLYTNALMTATCVWYYYHDYFGIWLYYTPSIKLLIWIPLWLVVGDTNPYQNLLVRFPASSSWARCNYQRSRQFCWLKSSSYHKLYNYQMYMFISIWCLFLTSKQSNQTT